MLNTVGPLTKQQYVLKVDFLCGHTFDNRNNGEKIPA